MGPLKSFFAGLNLEEENNYTLMLKLEDPRS